MVMIKSPFQRTIFQRLSFRNKHSAAAGALPTIYALSTPLSRAAIGVVRISGSQSAYIYQKLTGSAKPPEPRAASVRKLKAPATGVLLDEALTLFFKGPKSFTGEDILELHLHGGVAIMTGVLSTIKELHDPARGVNIRYAENGEFSRRAFTNSRFDLTELEGIREMIDAETETQRVSALSSMRGDNRRLFMQWRQAVLNNIALLTTVIDFGDDHDIDEVAELFDTVSANVRQLKQSIQEFLFKVERSKVLLDGIKITLLGPPNAGKSSLLNSLANKDAAIVSSIAGTTRDAIDVPLDVSGYKVVVGDTAGIRETTADDIIETEGIRRAKVKSLQSNIALVVLPMDDMAALSDIFKQHLEDLKNSKVKIVGILNKQDLVDDTIKLEALQSLSKVLNTSDDELHVVSCKTGYGLEKLTDKLTNLFKEVTVSDPIAISARAQDILRNDVVYGIDQFEHWKQQDDIVLATESLKQSVEGIGKITGEAIGVEEILGVVFSSFCIGK